MALLSFGYTFYAKNCIFLKKYENLLIFFVECCILLCMVSFGSDNGSFQRLFCILREFSFKETGRKRKCHRKRRIS